MNHPSPLGEPRATGAWLERSARSLPALATSIAVALGSHATLAAPPTSADATRSSTNAARANQPAPQLAAGLEAYQRGDWPAAVAGLEAALAGPLTDPQRTATEFFLSESLWFAGNAAQAARGYESVLQREPRGVLAPAASYRRGEVAVHLQQWPDAQQRLQAFVTDHPSSEWSGAARLLLGQMALQRGDFDVAQRWLQQSQQQQVTDRQRALAQLGQAQAEFWTGNSDRAAALLQQIATGRPIDANADWDIQFWNGLVDLARGQYGPAASTLSRLAQSDPDHPLADAAFWHAGEAYIGIQQWSQADLCYQEVLQHWPDSSYAPDALVGRMRAAMGQHRHEQVDALVRQFDQRFPTSELEGTVSRLRAESLQARGSYDQALRQFDALVAQDPRLTTDLGQRAAYGRVVALAGLGRYDEALDTLQRLDGAQQLAPARRRVLWDAQSILTRLTSSSPTPIPAPPSSGGIGSGSDPIGGGVGQGAESAMAFVQRQVQLGDYTRALNQIQADFALLANHPQLPELVRRIAEKSIGTRDQTSVDSILTQWSRGTGEQAAYGSWGRASLEGARRQTAAAITEVNRTLSQTNFEPLATEATMMRGQLYEQQQNWSAARQDYESLVQRLGNDPRAAHALLNAARMAERMNDTAGALAHLGQLSSRFPDHPRGDAAAYLEAWIHMDRQDTARAEPLFRWIHQHHTESRYWNDSTYRLSEFAFQRGDYGTTAQLLSQLLQGTEDPDVWPHALFLMGQVHAAQRDWSAARQQFMQLLSRYPDHALRDLATYWLGETYFQQRNFTAARQQFDQLSAAAATGTDSWKGMVLLRQAQLADAAGQWNQVSQLLNQLRTRFPQLNREDEINYLSARLLASEKRYNEARQQLSALLSRTRTTNPETAAMSQWMIGETYWIEKQYQRAINEYSLVRQQFDAYPYWVAAALYKSAMSYEALNRKADAEQLYRTLLLEPAYQQTEFARQAAERLLSTSFRPASNP